MHTFFGGYMKKGFTIVELIVVVTVIAILAAIVIIGYGSWSQDTTRTVVKSDVSQAAVAMQDAINASDAYPSSIPASFVASSDVTVEGGAIAGRNDFCVSASKRGISYFTTKHKIILPGTCPSLYYSPSESRSYSSGATEIKDLSGNAVTAAFRQGNTLNVSGPTFDAGSKVLSFDGNDTYVTPSVVTYGNDTTWTACARVTSSLNGFNMFMGRHLPYFGASTNGTSVVFSNIIGGSQRTLTSTSPALPLNTWNCYAFTTAYNGTSTTMSVYINGTLRTSGVYAGAQGQSSNRFAVGDGNYYTASPYVWYPFNGMIADVAVYPRTLSPEEIQEVYQYNKLKLGI